MGVLLALGYAMNEGPKEPSVNPAIFPGG